MAKRKETTTRGESASTADSMEQRMLAFAEQIGRVAGTMQAKAEGWLDREALNTQIASIRDGAADLLKQLAASTREAAAAATAGARENASNSTGRQAKASPKRSAAAGAKRQAGAKQPATKRAQSAGAGAGKAAAAARSGGRVDAPGKKHRGPMPSEGGATGRPRGDGERLAKLKVANMTRTQRRG
jgi:hypothetical protein